MHMFTNDLLPRAYVRGGAHAHVHQRDDSSGGCVLCQSGRVMDQGNFISTEMQHSIIDKTFELRSITRV